MSTPPNLDPVSVAVVIAASIGLPLAPIIGPYAVIIVAAITGAAWSLGRREATTRAAGAWYFFRLVLTAVMLSVGIEELVYWLWRTPTDSHWMLAPIAIAVGLIGDDWPKLGRWVIFKLLRKGMNDAK